MPNTKILSVVAVVLLLVGGINYFFVGLMGTNLIINLLGHFLGRVLCLCIGVGTGYLIYLKATKQDIYY